MVNGQFSGRLQSSEKMTTNGKNDARITITMRSLSMAGLQAELAPRSRDTLRDRIRRVRLAAEYASSRKRRRNPLCDCQLAARPASRGFRYTRSCMSDQGRHQNAN